MPSIFGRNKQLRKGSTMAFAKKKTTEPVFADERKRQRDSAGLSTELCSPNPSAHRGAAGDLADYPKDATSFVERLTVEPEVSAREIILTTLAQQDDVQVAAGLVECLRSDDAARRYEAIEALAQMPSAIAPIIRGLLCDPDPDARIFAVSILESLRHPDVETWLIQVIESDPHVNVCATAVDLLGEVGTEAALESLERLHSRFADEPFILFAADMALKRISKS
jgi:HEAT repeat protein